MNTETIKDNELIKCTIKEDNIEVSISYPKRSQLATRFGMLEKLKEVLRRI